MTSTQAVAATEPIIRARLNKAQVKHYRRGVLGLRAKPVWDGGVFDHAGSPVRVVACPSVLAIWEAIDARDPQAWTVILTSVADEDLSDTVLAHLLDGRLFTPDPWDALRSNFSAATIEPALYRSPNDRAVANGLLGVLPSEAYAPAPGGVLTQDHAMSTVARTVLNMVRPDVEVDALAILEWSLQHDAAERFIDLQASAGPDLTTALTAWLAARAGRLAQPLTVLMNSGQVADLVPLGIVAGLFCDENRANDKDLGLFLGHYKLSTLTADDLQSWYTATRGLVTTMLADEHRRTVLDAAAAVVDDLGIRAAAQSSDLLRHGLTARLHALAEAITAALPPHLPDDLSVRLISVEALQSIERAWRQVNHHLLAATTSTTEAFAGAVRLTRWLAQPIVASTGLAEATTGYVRSESWVDAALIKARRGADGPATGAALRGVIETVLARRAGQDRRFAAALAGSAATAVPTIENVLRERVVPLARTTREHQSGTLLIVVDALSVAAANNLIVSLQTDGWTEISATAAPERAFAMAVLPTLTQRSRCSLLCGELREGDAAVERAGFVALLREQQLEATGGATHPIFHKKALDAIPSGLQLAIDVNNAIADTARQPLVAVVLNYVDDTLHHTDPGGTDWTLDTITHLRALLHAAKNAGRAVVITSDHGHIIDYGASIKLDRANTYGQRAHGDFDNVDPDREVVVSGPRVLTQNRRAVLAFDETVRYCPRNAGYHGGATPAEAVVPVIALVAGRVPEWALPVSGAEPPWWNAGAVATPVSVSAPVKRKKTVVTEPSLFDDAPIEQKSPLPDKVIRSKVFIAQLKLAGRTVLGTPQFTNLLGALLATGSHEITHAQAASALGVASASINGALMQAKRVLDVEGYEVLRVERDAVGLDVAALKEQFGVSE